MKTRILLFILLSGILCCNAIKAQNVHPDYADGALYVKFKTNSAAAIATVAQKSESRFVSTENLITPAKGTKGVNTYAISPFAYSMNFENSKFLQNTYRIEFEKVEATEDFIKELQQREDVEYVEKVPLATIFVTDSPNDSMYGMYGGINTSWHLDMIGFKEVYGKYKASPSIKVAVVDNAVWGEHPDLQVAPSNQYFPFVMAEGNSAPPSNIAQDTKCSSLSFCPASEWSHGTHCAGLVAALTDNGTGIASFGSGATLLAVRCSDNSGLSMGRGYAGMVWAADKGAKIMSLSWGGTRPSKVEEEVTIELIAKGIIIVAAAGNDNSETIGYPAGYEGVIAVGSVDSDKRKSDFSCFGDWVHIAAPGGSVKLAEGKPTYNGIHSTTYSTSQSYRLVGNNKAFEGTFYDSKEGTSMSTPLVASVLTLMVSVYPDLSPAKAKEILMKTSTSVVGNFPMAKGGGIINATEAIKAAEAENEKVSNLSEETAKSNTVSIYPNPATNTLYIESNTKIRHAEILDISGKKLHSQQASELNRIDVSFLKTGLYFIKVKTDLGYEVLKFVLRK